MLWSSYLSNDFFSFFSFKRENPIILFLIFLPSVRDRFFHFCPVNYSNRQLTIIVFERNSDRVVPSYRAVRYYLSGRKLHSSKNYRFFFFFYFFPFTPPPGTFHGGIILPFYAPPMVSSRIERKSFGKFIADSRIFAGESRLSIPFLFLFRRRNKGEKNDFLNIKTWKPVIVLNRNEKNKKGDCSNLFIYLFFLFSSIGKSSGIVP